MTSAMHPVVWVAIAVLVVVFFGALVGIILLCWKQCKRNKDLLTRAHADMQPDQNLVGNIEVADQLENPSNGVELDSVSGVRQKLERILEDEDWVMDASGLAPHCLDILRTCHHLSEKLVGMTMHGNSDQLISPENMTDLVATAKRIGPRVDDVVRALYPPLDPRLLEARCTALVLSVSHLVLITKNACRMSGVLDWIDQSLADVEDHLRVLREASINYEASCCSASNHPQETSVDAPCTHLPTHYFPTPIASGSLAGPPGALPNVLSGVSLMCAQEAVGFSSSGNTSLS